MQINDFILLEDSQITAKIEAIKPYRVITDGVKDDVGNIYECSAVGTGERILVDDKTIKFRLV